jgi:hypothetical protein
MSKLLLNEMEILRGTLDRPILKTVAPAPIHGYGIAMRLKQISKDVLGRAARSLYPRPSSPAEARARQGGVSRIGGRPESEVLLHHQARN